MKKILKYLLIFCVFVNSCFYWNVNCNLNKSLFAVKYNSDYQSFFVSAETVETTTYAKVLSGCNLYKTKEMSNEYQDVYFQVPETYFVIILETVNDDCFKVQYDKYIGYVQASTVVVASFIPIVKTLSNITFDIKSTSGTQIWQYPTTKSDICTTISAGTKDINYVAYAYGSVPSDGESNIWYYVYYTPDSNSTNVYEGYIYSENTTNLSEIISNTETNPSVISNEQEEDNLFYISSTIKTIVIAIIAIPIILFFVIILYKIIKKLRKKTKYDDNSLKLNNDAVDEFAKSKNLKHIEKYKNMTLVKNKKPMPNFSDFNDEDLL